MGNAVMTMTTRVSAEMVEEAGRVIRPYLTPTRLVETRDSRGRAVHLKLESEQPTGSFKVRGALSNLLRQPATPAGFVAASAGNHGLGVAFAAQQSGRREQVTIFVPGSAPETKIAKLRKFPIDLRIVGETYDDAERAGRTFESETGAVFIHAYDDPLTAAGQGTLILEVREALEQIGTIVVPVGGGGLITGVAAWLGARMQATHVVAVQPDASPALAESNRLGVALLEYQAGPTIADGLSGGIGQIVFEHRQLIDQMVNVPESMIKAAVRDLQLSHGIRCEGSAAITWAALHLSESEDWPEPIVCVITGSNIDPKAFEALV